MSFLQPILLLGLPLALLPVLIHLINQHRHRTVKWAAMMFLLNASKMTKGLARLRQILILTMRVLAVVALLFAASRPLAGGWLALTGGRADTVVVLLDRSASMEQQHVETGESKRLAALAKIADLLSKTARGSELVLIDSASMEPVVLEDASDLLDFPRAAATATAADIPALLTRALDYLATDESGRTDIWLASDLRHSDWDPGSGRWPSIRSELATRDTVRLFLLAFPETAADNLAVSVRDVKRRRSPEGLHLVMDLAFRRPGALDDANPVTVPVELTINGTRTVEEMSVVGTESLRLGHVIHLSEGDDRGWGRVDLPADENLADNTAFFVFDQAAPRQTVIVSDHGPTAAAIRAAAGAAPEASVSYEALALSTEEVTRIPWEETALIVWHAVLPDSGSNEAKLLEQHLDEGRTLVLLPPLQDPIGTEENEFLGLRWSSWLERTGDSPRISWWRTETGLLENTRSGAPLPVENIELFRVRAFEGETQSLLRLESGETVIGRAVLEKPGALYLWGTLPDMTHSTLATDGVVFFVMLHRALEEGAGAVSKARIRETGPGALPNSAARETLASADEGESPAGPEWIPGAFELNPGSEDAALIALNRPEREDDPRTVTAEAIGTLLEGVEFRQFDDEVNSGSSLASEVWRTFLIVMALALVTEAALSLPTRTPSPPTDRFRTAPDTTRPRTDP